MRFWIVELGELGETMKREKLDALKQYFTQKTDVLRKPYARGIMEYPRRTVFIGTVNGDGFLKDNTGDRRYWPIAVEQVNNSTNVDISQVWGQVMHLWKDSEGKAYLTDEEIAKLEDMNQQYKFISAEERALLDLLDWDAPSGNWRKATATILCEELNFPHSYNRRMALQALSKKNNQVKVPTRHGSERLYTVPPLRSCAPTYDELGILK